MKAVRKGRDQTERVQQGRRADTRNTRMHAGVIHHRTSIRRISNRVIVPISSERYEMLLCDLANKSKWDEMRVGRQTLGRGVVDTPLAALAVLDFKHSGALPPPSPFPILADRLHGLYTPCPPH